MVAGAAVCAGVLFPSSPAAADESTEAVCTFTTVVRHRPGYLLTTETRGAVATAQDTPVSCLGRVDGQDLAAAPGTLSVHGTYVGTCLTATADGRLRIELRTVAGDPVILQGPIEVARTGLVVQGGGELDGVPFTTTMVGAPDPAHPEEDCVTEPLDHVLVTGVIAVGSGSGRS